MSQQQQTVPIVSHTQMGEEYYVVGVKAPWLAQESRPGQFVMCRIPHADLLWGRAFSVYNVIGDEVQLLYKVMGRGTTLLAQKQVGELLEITGPLGNTFSEPQSDQFLLLVGGGVGLPPLYFYAKTFQEHVSRMRVMIGARDQNNVILEKEFKALGCQVEVATDDGSVGLKGLVTELLKNSIRNNSKVKGRLVIASCGPNPMLKAVSEIGKEHGIMTEVSLEESMACGLGVCIGCVVKTHCSEEQKKELKRDETYTRLCVEGPVLEGARVIWE